MQIASIATSLTKKRVIPAYLQVILGSVFLALCSNITIPLPHVPITCQTLGIFILALTQGGRKASFSTLLYLAYATCGLPVLAGGLANCLWFLTPRAGYLLAFPIAAYIIGKMNEGEKTSPWRTALSILIGQAIIFTLGVGVLSYAIGWKSALLFGFYPFIIPALLKNTLVLLTKKIILKSKLCL